MNRVKLFLGPILLASLFINITPVYAHDTTYTTYLKQAKYLERVAHIKQAKYLERVSALFLKTKLDCLAKNIYFEAGNQNTKGKLAVGHVTLNRLTSPRFPDTICEIIKQKAIVKVNKRRWKTKCQFSWFCDGKSDRPDFKSEEWKDCVLLAKLLLTRPVNDVTKGALYFHADYVYPAWRKEMIFIAKIDDHLFYKPKNMENNKDG